MVGLISDPVSRDRAAGAVDLSVEEPCEASVVVRVSGEVDARGAEDLESVLCAQLGRPGVPRRLVVDLGAVGSITAVGLDVLLRVEKRCWARGIRLCLADCRQPVTEPLHVAALSDHFRHYFTAAAAVAHTHRVHSAAELARLLPAAENLLQAIAASERGPRGETGRPDRLPATLTPRLTLSALYRVWEALAEQLRPQLFPGRGEPQKLGAHVVRLPDADLVVLTRAALALQYPTDDLTALVSQLRTAGHDPQTLAQLLKTLIPGAECSTRGCAAAPYPGEETEDGGRHPA